MFKYQNLFVPEGKAGFNIWSFLCPFNKCFLKGARLYRTHQEVFPPDHQKVGDLVFKNSI